MNDFSAIPWLDTGATAGAEAKLLMDLLLLLLLLLIVGVCRMVPLDGVRVRWCGRSNGPKQP